MIAETHKKAFIRDGALVLYFETAENPVVSRFDLDSLAQANFEVNKREPNFALVLKDFSGSEQTVAQFSSKADAHQALYAILQALLDHQPSDKSCGTCCRKSSGWCRFFKWIFGILTVFVLIYLALILLAGQIDTTAVPEKTAMAETAPVMPQGESVDLDAMLSDTGSSE